MEQYKVDIQVSRESDIKKVQEVFDKVKEEETLNVGNFFVDDNDIFDSEQISNADRECGYYIFSIFCSVFVLLLIALSWLVHTIWE